MDKVLIVRSAPVSYVRDILPAVMDRFGTPRIEVLTNSVARPELLKFLEEGQVIIYPKEKLSLFKTRPSLLMRLSGKYRAVIVPYTNLWGEGYRNVELMGLALGAQELWSVDKKGGWHRITLTSFLKRQVNEVWNWTHYSIHWVIALTRMALKVR